MGCDIHCKVFLYNKKKKEYLDVNGNYKPNCDIVYDNPFGKIIVDKIQDLDSRYYDFFGIMGNNSRSVAYNPMRCLKYDFPEYLNELMKEDFECSDFYGYCYCQMDKLIKGFTSYKTRLKKLKKKDDHENMIRYLEIIVDELESMKKLKDDPEFNITCDLNGYDIDFDKSLFVFFFDN